MMSFERTETQSNPIANSNHVHLQLFTVAHSFKAIHNISNPW